MGRALKKIQDICRRIENSCEKTGESRHKKIALFCVSQKSAIFYFRLICRYDRNRFGFPSPHHIYVTLTHLAFYFNSFAPLLKNTIPRSYVQIMDGFLKLSKKIKKFLMLLFFQISGSSLFVKIFPFTVNDDHQGHILHIQLS